MKILAFADLHQNKPALQHIIEKAKKEDVDVVVCAGDFTIFGEGMQHILAKLDKIGKPVLIVQGNHEEFALDELRKSCLNLKNCYLIHNKGYRKDGYLFLGWGGGGFSLRDRQFEKHWHKFREMVRDNDKIVLVTHAPPYKTKIDKIRGEHAGNNSIRKFIKIFKPVLAISGHLEECVGHDKIGKTLVINPGYKGKVIIV